MPFLRWRHHDFTRVFYIRPTIRYDIRPCWRFWSQISHTINCGPHRILRRKQSPHCELYWPIPPRVNAEVLALATGSGSQLIEARRVLAAAPNLCDVPCLETVLAAEVAFIRNLTIATAMGAPVILLLHNRSPFSAAEQSFKCPMEGHRFP